MPSTHCSSRNSSQAPTYPPAPRPATLSTSPVPVTSNQAAVAPKLVTVRQNTPPAPRPVTPTNKVPVTSNQVAVAPKPVPIPNITPQQSDEPLDRLTPRGLPVAPNSPVPLTNVEAIALQQELENLIGRFESTVLAANAANNQETKQLSVEATQVASTNTSSPYQNQLHKL